MSIPLFKSLSCPPSRQRGAALFVAMMVLIIMSLIAISAAQVTGLQERMASIYRADELAFEAAENQLRNSERRLLASRPWLCDGVPNPKLPAQLLDADVENVSVENLNNSQADSDPILGVANPYNRGLALGGSRRVGQDRSPGTVNCLVFRITSLDKDDDADPTARALVQSTFTP